MKTLSSAKRVPEWTLPLAIGAMLAASFAPQSARAAPIPYAAAADEPSDDPTDETAENEQADQLNDSVDVPSDWVQLPEDQPRYSLLTSAARSFSSAYRTHRLETMVDRIFDSNQKAFAVLPDAPNATPLHPHWHLEYITTDLSLTAQGKFGVLTIKGTPSISAFWRKKPQESAITRNAAIVALREPDDGGASVYALDPGLGDSDMNLEAETMARTILATGKVKDGNRLRQELRAQISLFRDRTRELDRHAGSGWWVAGFRSDFSIEASGKVQPWLTVGADLRLRFEWRRMSKHGLATEPKSTANEAFLNTLETALETLADDRFEAQGFVASAFRVGVGITANGDFGVAKGSATLIGQINFARDITRPIRRHADDVNPLLPILEAKAPLHHLDFATEEGIAFEQDARGQARYQIPMERFQSGLEKALRMSEHFVRSAQRSRRRQPGHWNVAEIKAGFELSLTGSIGMAGIGGLAVSEITFVNRDF